MTSDWKIMQSELLFQNRWIELYEDKVEVRTGKVTHYTWYKSPFCIGVAVIVPFLDQDTLVMIRQFRHPLRKVLLEFPAGPCFYCKTFNIVYPQDPDYMHALLEPCLHKDTVLAMSFQSCQHECIRLNGRFHL